VSRKHVQIAVGDVVAARELTTIRGEVVTVPDPRRLIHLQFRRFAGCPICNTHLRSIVTRHDEIEATGVREVVVFHSSVANMLPYQGDLPFAAIADPEKRLYAEFGVRESVRAIGSLSAAGASLRGIAKSVRQGGLRRTVGSGERHLGLPADILIGPDATVVASKYGKHAYDQWSVEEILGLGQRFRSLVA
jgi:hypothetical protein